MAPPHRRIVRRAPLSQRIKNYLDPWDFVLWLSEEFESGDWDQWQKDWGTSLGVSLNLIMLLARGSSGATKPSYNDDVFGDDMRGSSWLSWLASFIVHLLSFLSFLNAGYTFYRKRRYRLFEASIDVRPSTPSAQRVKVESSPTSSSPLRYLSSIIASDSESAASRAHPDASKDVWELAVWDPSPISLKLFCHFSPGHVLVYWLFLPTTISDPRPSVTVVTAILLAALLSLQLSLLQQSFTQQAKDSAVIHKEVMNEYDVKYVHPRTQPLTRDVGTQYTDSGTSKGDISDTVDVYTPVHIINRGFHTRPNPNYSDHLSPDGAYFRASPTRDHSTSSSQPLSHQTPAHLRDASSPLQPRTALRQPQFRPPTTSTGDGGSLGVHTHAQSPLRKSASTHFSGGGGGAREHDRSTSPVKRASSPLKRSTFAGGSAVEGLDQRQARWPRLQSNHPRRESGRY